MDESRGNGAGRTTLAALSVALVPLLIFTAHASLFGDWVVDDAGISFAYARNLAAGHGLVAQPGVRPVEGFTNLLWVLIAWPLFAVGWFTTPWTVKVLAILLTAGSFALVARTLQQRAEVGWAFAISALAITSLQPGFVMWSVSGLENPLYVFLVCLLLYQASSSVLEDDPPLRLVIASALVCQAISLTRPDGFLFSMAIPFLLLLGASNRWKRPLAAFGSTYLVSWLIVVCFRWRYFGDLLPNTYYAKGGPGWRTVVWLEMHLPEWLFPWLVGSCMVLAIVGAWSAAGLGGVLARRWAGGGKTTRVALWVFVALAFTNYHLLPGDWMPEYRFASPVFILLPAAIVSTVEGKRYRSVAVALLGLASLAYAQQRLPSLRDNLIVPLDDVERLAEKFEAAAGLAGVEGASVLVPDIGGMLFRGGVRVYDLPGLCDRTIARTFLKDTGAFNDYVLEEARPTFIRLHSYWKQVTQLEDDPRFERDYVVIWERADGDEVFWTRRAPLEGREAVLPALRAVFAY